jgi:hypothetical protein
MVGKQELTAIRGGEAVAVKTSKKEALSVS